ncbi:MAG: hypothetical protein EP338_06040 [Bacteroidetes bacterium]|nr:MAG: hypothetical protein EP338_06040 [Bacteroidota bacterium]
MIQKKLHIIFCLFLSTSLGQSIDTSGLRELSFYLQTGLAHAPSIQIQQENIKREELEVKLNKTYWLREVAITADIKYGRYGNLNPIDQLNLGYGSGIYLRLPVTSIIGQKKRMKQAEAQLHIAQLTELEIKEQIRLKIMRLYCEANGYLRQVKIYTESCDHAYINYRISTKKYELGQIEEDAYARMAEIYFQLLAQLEKMRSEFESSKLALHEICGIAP